MNKKLALGMLFLLIGFGALPAFAQISNITHVILVIQENRTPDNLFQDPIIINHGAEILPGNDLSGESPAYASCVNGNVYLQPLNKLDPCFDPQHGHSGSFNSTEDGGAWDGACTITIDYDPATCTLPTSTPYANYTYVTNYASSPSAGILDPYFQLAEQYGFANYMFQTNEGPSFLAHQFLFSGTSAPEGYSTSDTNYQLFAAENPTPGQLSGCASAGPSTGNPGTLVEDISSVTGGEGYDYQPPYYYDLVEAAYGYPCYDHASMANLLDNGGITWKYYTNYPPSANTIWTAPNAFYKICGYHPGQDGDQGACVNNTANNDWDKVDYQTYGDILNDINNTDCTALKNVSWVIPDGHWSDHPGGLANGFGDGGPSWAAAIVNAVGDSTCGYWNNTVILVVWDDWGGWYDHIQPYTTGGYIGGSNHNGQSYVYGLRVPLLVVSGYTKTSTDGGDGYTGYISGTSTQGGENDGQYVHDFGSILGFIEHVFGLDTATGFCGIAGSDSDYPEGCNYPYADYFAPDGPHDTECGVTLCPYPLSDFFDFTDSVNAFHTIEGAKYAPDCFTDPSRDTCFGTDFEPASPDMDDVHPQN